jgi:hypothetical protein
MTLEEEVARALCASGGYDPDEIMSNDGPRWLYYADLARAAIAVIEPRAEAEGAAKERAALQQKIQDLERDLEMWQHAAQYDV